jgi:hypothetical protein
MTASKNFTGVVTNVNSPSTRTKQTQNLGSLVMILLDDSDNAPKLGDRVVAHVVLSDEDIGRKLREALTLGVLDRQSIADLAETIDESAGWPVLGDLIREVGL